MNNNSQINRRHFLQATGAAALAGAAMPALAARKATSESLVKTLYETFDAKQKHKQKGKGRDHPWQVCRLRRAETYYRSEQIDLEWTLGGQLPSGVSTPGMVQGDRAEARSV